MPIYEYACEACGTEFEYLVRNGEAAVCPECRKATELTKRFSVPAAHTSGGKSSADVRCAASFDVRTSAMRHGRLHGVGVTRRSRAV